MGAPAAAAAVGAAEGRDPSSDIVGAGAFPSRTSQPERGKESLLTVAEYRFVLCVSPGTPNSHTSWSFCIIYVGLVVYGDWRERAMRISWELGTREPPISAKLTACTRSFTLLTHTYRPFAVPVPLWERTGAEREGEAGAAFERAEL